MENKTSKYFKYAIGEIVLVVIGILIALQINNWNQQRIENIEEQIVLLNLKQDFEFNYGSLDSMLTRTRKHIKLQFLILNHTGNKPNPKTEDEFNNSINSLFSTSEFYPRNGYLDDLLNSGKLGIIKNQDLRNRLSSWGPFFNKIRNRELSVERTLERIYVIMEKRGSWLDTDAVGATQTVKNNSFPKSGFDIDNRNLLDFLEFENQTENVIYQNDLLTISQNQGLELIEDILKLIENEIDK